MEIASNFGNKFSGRANGCQRIVYEYIIELIFVATFGITTYIYYPPPVPPASFSSSAKAAAIKQKKTRTP